MAGRPTGLFGLLGGLIDEAKWFADQRAPYPIEANMRSAALSPFGGGFPPGSLLQYVRGMIGAVLDDEVDSTASRPASPDRPRDDLAELRAELRFLTRRTDRLARSHAG